LEKYKEREHTIVIMEIYMKDRWKMVFKKEKEFIIIIVVVGMKDIG